MKYDYHVDMLIKGEYDPMQYHPEKIPEEVQFFIRKFLDTVSEIMQKGLSYNGSPEDALWMRTLLEQFADCDGFPQSGLFWVIHEYASACSANPSDEKRTERARNSFVLAYNRLRDYWKEASKLLATNNN